MTCFLLHLAFRHIMLLKRQWPRFAIHCSFSFPPCSAAVRAQHMELGPSWQFWTPRTVPGASKIQSFGSMCPRCFPRGSKLAPTRVPRRAQRSILAGFSIDLGTLFRHCCVSPALPHHTLEERSWEHYFLLEIGSASLREGV